MKKQIQNCDKRVNHSVIICTLALLFYCGNGFSKTVTSINNGNWNSTSTWDCGCLPANSDNVVISSGHSVVLDTDVTLNDLTIALNGTFDASPANYHATVKGNWVNHGNFIHRYGKVTLKGNNQQRIEGTALTTFYELEVNQPQKKGVVLNAPAHIARELTLTKGMVYTDPTNHLTLKSRANTNGGTNLSYISGPVIIETDTIKEIVIGTGKNGVHKKTSIAINDTDPSDINVEYFDEAHPNTNSVGNGIDHVCEAEYWDVVRLNGNAQASVKLFWNASACGPIKNAQALRVARHNGSQWVDEGGMITGNGASGAIASHPLNDFGSFTFGCSHAGTTNKTADNTEDNFSGYSSLSFDDNGAIAEPVSGIKKVDNMDIQVYPNPAHQNDNLCINVYGDAGQEILVVVMDMLGKEHYSKICARDNGKYTMGNDYANKLSPGMYLVVASSKNKFYNKKIVIK